MRRREKTLKEIKENPVQSIASTYDNLKKRIDKRWDDYCYTINGVKSESYISPRLYHNIIEPVLNNKLMVSTIKDKNFYELFFQNVSYPLVILRKINGIYYDQYYSRIVNLSDYMEIIDVNSFIMKSSLDSGGGKAIYLFACKNNKYYSDNVLFDEVFLENYKYDFVIQEKVSQHSFYENFNISSNNTVRVLVYRSVKDDSVNVLHTMFRVGAAGAFLDHDNYGGVTLAVDHNGHLSKHAFNNIGKKYFEFNNVVFSKQFLLPFYDEIIDMAKCVSKQSFYARLLALDFTVSYDGKVYLLDVNCWHNGISQYQFHNATLFGTFTREILDYCSKNTAYNIIRFPVNMPRV